MVRTHCCTTATKAAQIIGQIWLVVNVINIIDLSTTLANYDEVAMELGLENDGWKPAFQFSIAMLSFIVLVDAGLIYGCYKKIECLLTLWMVMSVIYSILFLLGAICTGDLLIMGIWIGEFCINMWAVVTVGTAVGEISSQKQNAVYPIA